ncbi:MAG TPA: hypothetical protein DIU48_02260, partial [Acidobacteria bacterium]|nr:hypothetical protein [Acidobacteriota bacterium]
MTDRISSLSSASVVVCCLALAPATTQAQNTGSPTEAPPRTAWGAPDLNGVWDFRTLTPFERPRELADQEFFTDEQAAAFEAERLAEFAVRDDQEPADIVGNYNQFWFDPGNKVSETNTTSLVVDPPNGRVPPLTVEADARRTAEQQVRQ